MNRIAPGCVALFLAACARAREPVPPIPPPTAVVSRSGEISPPGLAAASIEARLKRVGREDFSYLTEIYPATLLFPWLEADPAAYSGTYRGEFGDTGHWVEVKVRAGDGGYQVTGVMKSLTAGFGEHEMAFGPVPLRLDGGTVRFATPDGTAVFLVFSREHGQPPLRGFLIVGPEAGRLFHEKEEPES